MVRLTCRCIFPGPILLAILLVAPGCSTCYGPNQTVKVVLYGASDSARQEAMQTLLPTLVDQRGRDSVCYSASETDASLIVDLGPVSTPNTFADRIWFGTVEKMEGRTIYVEVNETRTQILALAAKIVQFITELPRHIQGYIFFGKIKFIAWWTGKTEVEVFWALARLPVSEANREVAD